jgi:phage terminase large subunit-like protein
MPCRRDRPPTVDPRAVATQPASTADPAVAESWQTLAGYRPYPKQREVHAAGRVHRERLFMAGNQLGKTLAGGMEIAMHATGRYPAWWRGRMFAGPVRIWVAGITAESTRDNPQRILLGPPAQQDAWGSGTIPKSALDDVSRQRGVTDAVDVVSVRHTTGGLSMIAFKAYEKGRQKWQGETLDGVWFGDRGQGLKR